MRWATRTLDDVPPDDAWLGPRERAVLAGLEGERRRAEWRLGRWTAKQLVPAAEILPAADGAPEAWLGDVRSPLAISIAHRRGRALAVAATDGPIGCDLEPVLPGREVSAFVAWEAAAKARRRGLLSGARPEVTLAASTFRVRWADGETIDGVWRVEDGWVLAMASGAPSRGRRPIHQGATSAPS